MQTIARRTAVRETIFVKRDLSAGVLELERRADGQLWATQSGDSKPVTVRRCFPWSDPTRFISLQDEENNEFALVRHPAELDPKSHDALNPRTPKATDDSLRPVQPAPQHDTGPRPRRESIDRRPEC